MKKIQDRFVAGAISGLGDNIVKNMIQRGALMLGIAKETSQRQGAGFFLRRRKVDQPMGDVIGMLTDNALAAGIGVVGSYLFTVTGRDHPFIKGVTHGHLSWLVAYRILARMGANPIKSADPVTQGVTWFSHGAFGITQAYLLRAIADPSLFEPEAWGMPDAVKGKEIGVRAYQPRESTAEYVASRTLPHD